MGQITRRMLIIFGKRNAIAREQNALLRMLILFSNFISAIQNHCITLEILILPEPPSEIKVCQIVTLKNLGFLYRRTAYQLGLHNRFTARIGYQGYLQNKDLYARKSSGRPKKFTVRE